MEIIKDVIRDNEIYVVLIYRSFSRRVPRKNVRKFSSGMSLLDIKMRQLSKVFPNENIIMAGDDDIITATKCIKRDPDKILSDKYSFHDVLDDIYEKIAKKYPEVKHLLITYPTCPMFNESDYQYNIMHYYNNVINGNHDSLATGVSMSGFFWHKNKPVNYNPTNHPYTQQLDDIFMFDNCLYGGKFIILRNKKYLIGDKPYFGETPFEHTTDVDTMGDFEYAREQYSKREHL